MFLDYAHSFAHVFNVLFDYSSSMGKIMISYGIVFNAELAGKKRTYNWWWWNFIQARTEAISKWSFFIFVLKNAMHCKSNVLLYANTFLTLENNLFYDTLQYHAIFTKSATEKRVLLQYTTILLTAAETDVWK